MGSPWSTRWRQKLEREKETAIAIMLQNQLQQKRKQGGEALEYVVKGDADVITEPVGKSSRERR